MSEKEHPCGNCYWWDAVGLEADPFLHLCHEPHGLELGLATPSNGGALCPYHRPITPDDPATTWNRRSPGRKTKSPRAAKDPAAVKRGKSSKRKGKKRENELAKVQTEQTDEEWEVRGGDNDVQTKNSQSPWRSVHFENKGYRKVGAMRFCEQAMEDAATHGKSEWVVCFREDAKPGHKKPPHIAMQPLADYNRMKMAEFLLWDMLGGPLTMQELHERRGKDVG